MKKTAIALMVALGAISSAHASEKGYAQSMDGSVVTSNYGLCWETSSDKNMLPECGDKMPDPPAPKEAPRYVAPPAPKPAVVMKKVKVTMNAEVLFKFDSSNLTLGGMEVLDEQVVRLNPQHVVLEGHTDKRGSDAYNQKLSLRRANAVKKYLISQGVPAQAIEAHGMGESQPLCKENTSSCHQQNRRVEITATTTN